jgi:hypothetical protein
MSTESATGVPNPDKPDHWLVPPWPATLGIRKVVGHFADFSMYHSDNPVHLYAYYRGYDAALEAAPTDELTRNIDWQWYEEMRGCISRLHAHYQNKLAAVMS